MEIINNILQTIFIIVFAPLVSGFIRKIKNNFRMRKGASIFQPYYNFLKLMSKEEVVSENTSWIFAIAPYVILCSSIAALMIVPLIVPEWSLNLMGDFLLVIFLLALGRFFIALAGLDAGSAFGGMGSSREMFISSLVEPVAILAVFAVAIKSGATSFKAISSINTFSVSNFIAFISLFLVTIAETSRMPVDNQETHLELTMVHEAMVLEYSGWSLAIIELASHIKQIIFFSILGNLLMPNFIFKDCSISLIFIIFLSKITLISIIVSVIEVSVAKMRLFRVLDFLAFGYILSIIAVISAVMGF